MELAGRRTASGRLRPWRLAADLTTLAVVLFGLGALILRAHTRPALGLIILAGVFDGVDGALARKAGGPTAYGALLDVFADLFSFAVVPAILVLTVMPVWPWLVWTSLALFLSVAVMRLLRSYRTVLHRGSYIGLTMPGAAILLLAVALTFSGPAFSVGALIVTALAGSARPHPSLPDFWRRSPLVASLVGLIGIGLTVLRPEGGLERAVLLVGGTYAVSPWLARFTQPAAADGGRGRRQPSP